MTVVRFYGEEPVEQLGGELGYQSEATMSHAFIRQFQVTSGSLGEQASREVKPG